MFCCLMGALLLTLIPVPVRVSAEDSQVSEDTDGADAGEAERTFRYRYLDGESYRILSTVQSDAYVDGRFSHQEHVLNRIVVDVEKLEDERGKLHVSYQISRENSRGQSAFQLGRQYQVEYIRDVFGHDEVPEGSPRPMVRNVPLFPERELAPGDTWASTGIEVLDLRESFGIDAVETFEMPVSYEYVGVHREEDRTFDIFELEYNMFYRIPGRFEEVYPERITGFSRQRHYWDRVYGRPHKYEETFEINYDLSNGQTFTWRGSAEARITDSSFDDREEVIRRMREQLENPDADVRDDDEGITITLKAIGFEPDSTRLREGEEQKLAEIAAVLAEHDSGELLITGHTALAGTEEGRQRLSEERARVIAEYMLEQGVREPDALLYRGMGARSPVADNESEAGRRRNRRVEFTILED